jgi:hypothetical protein
MVVDELLPAQPYGQLETDKRLLHGVVIVQRVGILQNGGPRRDRLRNSCLKR